MQIGPGSVAQVLALIVLPPGTQNPGSIVLSQYIHLQDGITISMGAETRKMEISEGNKKYLTRSGNDRRKVQDDKGRKDCGSFHDEV